MKRLLALTLALAALTPLVAEAQTTILPIEEFLAAQSSAATNAWTTESGDKFVYLDYMGKWATRLGMSAEFIPAITGSVIIRPLKDGTARVSVMMFTRHALCWGGQWNDGVRGVAFGYLPQDVKSGAPASWGDGFHKFEFAMPSPDSPLPMYWQILYSADGYQLLSAKVEIDCTGTLRAWSGYPEGTPGGAHVTEVGLEKVFLKSGALAGRDGWPAEVVNFFAIGR